MLRVLLIRCSPEGRPFGPVVPPPVAPPLGLLHIASAARAWCREDVEVVVRNLSTDVRVLDDVPDLVRSEEPDLVGLGGLTLDEQRIFATARLVKEVDPAIPVVVGGPHATLNPALVLREPSVDWVVIGEGEKTATELFDAVASGGDPRRIPGMGWRDGRGGVATAGPRDLVPDLDSLPTPAWDLVDLELYSRLFNAQDMPLRHSPYATIMTSRGCPYHCTYCHHIYGHRPRWQSAGRVLDEMQQLMETRGVREFHIYDDIFNANAPRLMEICRGIEERGLDVAISFPNGLRADILKREHLEALRRAGCYSSAFALETASPRIQKLIRKHMDVPKLLESASIARDLGIITHCFTMLGFPTETLEEMDLTVRTAVEGPFDFPRFMTVCPFPGTGLFDLALEHGFDPEGHLGSNYDYDITIMRSDATPNVSCLSDRDIETYVEDAERRVYRHPERLERLERIIASFDDPKHPILDQGFWKLAREAIAAARPVEDAVRAVLVARDVFARDGRYRGDMQMALLSGRLRREGVRHAVVAIAGDDEPDTRSRLIDEVSRRSPEIVVLDTIRDEEMVDTLRGALSARVMTLDPLVRGDLPEALESLDPSDAVSAWLHGARTEDTAAEHVSGDDPGDFDPRFECTVAGGGHPPPQEVVELDLPEPPGDPGQAERIAGRRVETLLARLPDLAEIRVPRIERWLAALARVAGTVERPVTFRADVSIDDVAAHREAFDALIEACAGARASLCLGSVDLGSPARTDLDALLWLRARHDPASFMAHCAGRLDLFRPDQTIDGLEADLDAVRAAGLAGLFEILEAQRGPTPRDPVVARAGELYRELEECTGDRPGLALACLRAFREDGVRALEARDVADALTRLARRIRERPVPDGPRRLLGVGSQRNTGYRRDLQWGRTYPDEREEILAQARTMGDLVGARLRIVGPEPTMVGCLPALLADLRELGPDGIEIVTYGRRLVYPKYATLLVRAAPDVVNVLLHHPLAGQHDAAVRVPGAFEQATQGLLLTGTLGRSTGRPRTAVTAVAGPENSGRLVEFVPVARGLAAGELRIALPLANLDLASLVELEREVDDTVSAARAAGLVSGFDPDLGLSWDP